jgi:diguanylate cyclase (GGDEF)-like protein
VGALHEELFSAVDVGLAVWGADGGQLVVVEANPAARSLLRNLLQRGEVADRVVHDRRVLLALGETLAIERDQVVDGVLVADRVLQVRTHLLGEGRVAMVVIDVTAHHDDRRRLGHAARHDALTGLGNRREFLNELAAGLGTARAQDTRLAVIVLDLDRFKEVNDTLGHSQGDLLLAEVSRRLSALRDDVWGVSRVGGDEFALLASPTAVPAEAIAARIASTFAAPFSVGRMSIRATASVGVAAWPDHGDDAEELLRKADVAMWAAKQTGRGVSLYRTEDDRYNLRRLRLVSDLRDAINDGDLELHYQPKVDLGTGGVAGAEALVRWTHPEFGDVPPGEFVPIAEDSGLIGPLSHWVLGETGRQLEAWQPLGLDLHVSANISARNLYDPNLVRWLSAVFEDHGLSPGQLTLELTETQIAEDLPMARQILRRLQAIGTKLSIDDFGTGYSSLSYLSKLPLDEIKIDRSFVLDLATNHGATVVQTIIGLGHDLGLRVVAEGVETVETLEHLQGLGCDVAQGEYLSLPLPADEFENWLVAQADRGQSS